MSSCAVMSLPAVVEPTCFMFILKVELAGTLIFEIPEERIVTPLNFAPSAIVALELGERKILEETVAAAD